MSIKVTDDQLSFYKTLAQGSGIDASKYDANNVNSIVKALKSEANGYGVGSGNTIGNTIGNATLNNYGYEVKNGQIVKSDTISKNYIAEMNAVKSKYNTPTTTETQNNSADTYAALLAQMQQGYMDQLAAMKAEQDAQTKAATQATIDSINTNKASIQTDYDNAQRQNYINYVLSQNQLGDYMKAQGYTGGMTETTAQGLANNYANNRLTATQDRDSALLEMEKLIAEAQATGNTNLVNIAQNYMNTYSSAMQSNASNYLTALNMDQNKTQQEWENAYNTKSYNDSRSDVKSSEAKSKADQEYTSFAETYQNVYKTTSKIDSKISELQKKINKGEDTYGYYQSMINLLKGYKNSNFSTASGTSTSGSGSGGGSDKANPGKEEKPDDTEEDLNDIPIEKKATDAQTSNYNHLKYQIQFTVGSQSGTLLQGSLKDLLSQIKTSDLTDEQRTALINMMK